MYESKDEMVSHPQHYIRGGMETIDVITAFTEGLEGIEAYDTGAVLKYICRWKQKGGVQDLEKAMWYTQHLIDHVNDGSKEDAEEGDEEDNDNIGVTQLGRLMGDFAKRLPVGEVVAESKTCALVRGTDGYYRVVEYGDESVTKETEAGDGECTQRG